MTSLIEALQTKDSITENGMPTHSTSNSKLLDLLFRGGALRIALESEIVSVFSAAYAEDKLSAMKLLFWIRDIRGNGLGERRFFRICLKHLLATDPQQVIANIENIPYFGRWDDVLDLLTIQHCSDVNKTIILDYIASELLQKKNGLCAKWMPRPIQFKKNPRRCMLARRLMKHLKMSYKEYRTLLSTLTSVVESTMCKNSWNEIKYEHVPSLAMSRYKTAFYKHDSSRFSEYSNDLKNGNTTIHAVGLYPYQVIQGLSLDTLDVITSQWNSMLESLTIHHDNRILCVCDVSGSMEIKVSKTVSAMDVSVSLGMFISEKMNGPFHNAFITFSQTPQLQVLHGNLFEKHLQLYNACWGYSTNIEKVFDTILQHAKYHHVSQDDMPTSVLIISDMEFDKAVHYPNKSAFEMIHAQYQQYGYILPQIVFWNVASRSNNIPIKFNDNGVKLISGCSPFVLELVLDGSNPIDVLFKIINSERYDVVKIST